MTRVGSVTRTTCMSLRDEPPDTDAGVEASAHDIGMASSMVISSVIAGYAARKSLMTGASAISAATLDTLSRSVPAAYRGIRSGPRPPRPIP